MLRKFIVQFPNLRITPPGVKGAVTPLAFRLVRRHKDPQVLSELEGWVEDLQRCYHASKSESDGENHDEAMDGNEEDVKDKELFIQQLGIGNTMVAIIVNIHSNIQMTGRASPCDRKWAT